MRDSNSGASNPPVTVFSQAMSEDEGIKEEMLEAARTIVRSASPTPFIALPNDLNYMSTGQRCNWREGGKENHFSKQVHEHGMVEIPEASYRGYVYGNAHQAYKTIAGLCQSLLNRYGNDGLSHETYFELKRQCRGMLGTYRIIVADLKTEMLNANKRRHVRHNPHNKNLVIRRQQPNSNLSSTSWQPVSLFFLTAIEIRASFDYFSVVCSNGHGSPARDKHHPRE